MQLRRAALFRGRYWDRTSDLFRVREARYRCANRPLHPANRKPWFSPRWVRDSNPCIRLCRPLPRLSANPPCRPIPGNQCHDSVLRADDEIRTRDIHLGKVVLYQLSYVRISEP